MRWFAKLVLRWTKVREANPLLLSLRALKVLMARYHAGLYLEVSAAGVTSRRSLRLEKSNLIVLVDRHPADHHHPIGSRRADCRLAFHAHGFRVPAFRGLGLVRLAGPGVLDLPGSFGFCCVSMMLSFIVELSFTVLRTWCLNRPSQIGVQDNSD
jgi:hypothetical protein